MVPFLIVAALAEWCPWLLLASPLLVCLPYILARRAERRRAEEAAARRRAEAARRAESRRRPAPERLTWQPAPTPKRGPGRPRKNPPPDSDAPKRKPGRPRKNPAPDAAGTVEAAPVESPAPDAAGTVERPAERPETISERAAARAREGREDMTAEELEEFRARYPICRPRAPAQNYTPEEFLQII